jgi:hypothetical protein
MCWNVSNSDSDLSIVLSAEEFSSCHTACSSVLERLNCVVFRARHCIARSGGMNEVGLPCVIVEHVGYSAVMWVYNLVAIATSWSLDKRSPTECVCLMVCDLETSSVGQPRPDWGCCATERMSVYDNVFGNNL